MFKTLTTTVIAVATALSTSLAVAEVNLTSQTAGAGTPVGLTATALVEYASERGIANIQLKDGQTGTVYMQAVAEGKVDIVNAAKFPNKSRRTVEHFFNEIVRSEFNLLFIRIPGTLHTTKPLVKRNIKFRRTSK